jgi:quinoprotein glucose dehydrogenase
MVVTSARFRRARLVWVNVFSLLAGLTLSSQTPTDWPLQSYDNAGTRYSPLTQVTPENVSQLSRAWTYHTGDNGGNEATPLVIDNVVYFPSPTGVHAIDAVTGQRIWKYETEGTWDRGLAYWPGDRQTPPRIFTGAANQRMAALDAATGQLVTEFGDGGTTGPVQVSTPPTVYRDMIIAGSNAHVPGAYDVAAFDARMGEMVWSWFGVPRPGEFGSDTWSDWRIGQGAHPWGELTIDAVRGLLYVSTAGPDYDYYGGNRLGDNLYGNSLVALDAMTGEMKWYQQLVHHDLWDYDFSAPPTLIEVNRDGRRIPAVLATGKNALMFIFDRTDGTPVFGVEERPVPPAKVPTEETSPTQPFPVKPEPLGQMSMTRDDLYNLTPEHAEFCRDLWDSNNSFNDGPYTTFDTAESGRNAVIFPGTIGGSNVGGGAYDRSRGLIVINITNVGFIGWMEPGGPGQGRAWTRNSPLGPGATTARFWDPSTKLPCQNPTPPWGELIAIDANTGDIAWRVPFGIVQELEARGIRNTGIHNFGGPIVTASGLVFIAATSDKRIRAFETASGRELWSAQLEANGNAVPATYFGRDGKQYVVISAQGGSSFSDERADVLAAFSLP